MLHGDSEGWKAISRPLGHNIAQARLGGEGGKGVDESDGKVNL